MVSSKKIVIKINRSADQKREKPMGSAPSEITVWNIKRIIFAVIIAILFIVIPYFFLGDGLENGMETDTEHLVPEKTADKPPIVIEEEQEVPRKSKQNEMAEPKVIEPILVDERFKTINHHKITRGLLTDQIKNKEPVKELLPPFKVNDSKTLHLYYFTEIRDMKGQSLYHQWIKEGVVVQKTSINPQGNRWRVSSNRKLGVADIGHWVVQVLDKKGLIYNEIVFDVTGG